MIVISSFYTLSSIWTSWILKILRSSSQISFLKCQIIAMVVILGTQILGILSSSFILIWALEKLCQELPTHLRVLAFSQTYHLCLQLHIHFLIVHKQLYTQLIYIMSFQYGKSSPKNAGGWVRKDLSSIKYGFISTILDLFTLTLADIQPCNNWALIPNLKNKKNTRSEVELCLNFFTIFHKYHFILCSKMIGFIFSQTNQ